MRAHTEDGGDSPFTCVIETHRGSSTVTLRNLVRLEFPLQACVADDAPEIATPATTMRDFADKPLLIQ